MKHELLIALWTLAAPLSSQVSSVLVVAEDGSGDYSLLQDAVAAAADGDTILVRSGTYDDLVLEDLAVSVLAELSGQVSVQSLRIENLAAGKRALIAGIASEAATFGAPVWTIRDCAGTVVLQDCVVAPLIFDLSASNGQVVDVANSASVTLTRVAVAPLTTILSESTWAGLRVTDATVALFDCGVAGVDGNEHKGPGAGVRIEDGSLHASGSELRGGNGCTDGQGGAAGLTLTTLSSSATLLGTSVAGGDGSFGGPCGNGPAAPPLAGVVLPTELDPDARLCSVSSPVSDGGSVSALFEGQPGDFAFLLFSSGVFPIAFLPAANGPLLPDLASAALVSAGVLPAGGSLLLSEPVSFPFPGGAGQLFTQGLFLSDAGEWIAAAAQGVVYLGPGL